MLKKINWKKGYGEVIGYTIAVLFLIGFFSQIVGIYMYARCGHTLNDAVMNIGRSLVTEESIDDAQAKAKKGLEKYMGDTQIMPLNEKWRLNDTEKRNFCQQTNFISVKMRYIYGVSAGLK